MFQKCAGCNKKIVTLLAEEFKCEYYCGKCYKEIRKKHEKELGISD